MQRAVEGRDSGGELLWSYPSDKDGQIWGVNDVCSADLDGDGLDELIIGYNGGTGLHVLDSQGHLLWKNTDRANVWHVAAGDVDGDAKPEVLSTCVTGKVRVFSADGKHLRDLDPEFYAHMVRTWQPTDSPVRENLADRALEELVASRDKWIKHIREQELQMPVEERNADGVEATVRVGDELIEAELAKDPVVANLNRMINDMRSAIEEQKHPSAVAAGVEKAPSLIVVAGGDKKKATLALLDFKEKTRWSMQLSAPVANAAISSGRPWLAISLGDGNIRVVDLATGKEIAHLGGQGGAAGVAWLPVDDTLHCSSSKRMKHCKRTESKPSNPNEPCPHPTGGGLRSTKPR